MAEPLKGARAWHSRLNRHQRKNSFLDASPEDRARKYKALRFAFSWLGPLADKSRKVFWAGPADIAQMVGEMWSKPGEFYSLNSGPLLLAEANEISVFSQRLADGKAARPRSRKRRRPRDSMRRRPTRWRVYVIAPFFLLACRSDSGARISRR